MAKIGIPFPMEANLNTHRPLTSRGSRPQANLGAASGKWRFPALNARASLKPRTRVIASYFAGRPALRPHFRSDHWRFDEARASKRGNRTRARLPGLHPAAPSGAAMPCDPIGIRAPASMRPARRRGNRGMPRVGVGPARPVTALPGRPIRPGRRHHCRFPFSRASMRPAPEARERLAAGASCWWW